MRPRPSTSHCTPCAPALFFFNAPATTEIYTLSLHDALPILCVAAPRKNATRRKQTHGLTHAQHAREDRKSTRLNSSHTVISYAVFCLKKKKQAAPRPSAARRTPPVPAYASYPTRIHPSRSAG